MHFSHLKLHNLINETQYIKLHSINGCFNTMPTIFGCNIHAQIAALMFLIIAAADPGFPVGGRQLVRGVPTSNAGAFQWKRM